MAKTIIDPILSKVVQGYAVPGNVGYELFPSVPVNKSGGKVIEFTDRDFQMYNTLRSPGTNTKRVEVGYEGADYALANHSLEGFVPREKLRDSKLESPSIKLEKRAIQKPWRSMALELEFEQATIASDLSKYDDANKKVFSGTSLWTSPESDPIGDLATGVKAIRTQCGVEPNKLVLSSEAFSALKTHPKILARLGTTVHGKAVTAEALADLFEVETVVVGKAIYFDTETEKTADVWGNDAILAYVPTDADLDNEMPSYGFTYEMENHPYVEAKYYDNNAKTWYYPVTHERKPVIAGITAGYLFKNVAGA